MSESLPDQGAGIFALKEIFKKMDYDLQVTFAPLPRSKAMALAKNEISGFLPSTEDDIESGFALSKIVFETPWVIVERKNHPIHWKTGKDLAKFKGGNVIGYSVRPDLKKIFDKEKITLETAPD
ncbi:MAG TPA: hypothetical protein VN132_04345, partial [Bdellovibrio sp.]|nr:hypothetical protein [Bdellovibrio sp.]